MVYTVTNWILGAFALLSTICLMISFPGMLIAVLVEALKEIPKDQKRSLKWTKIFGIIFVISFAMLIATVVMWGIAGSLYGL